MKACKGLGTDEQALIDVLGSKSPEDRSLIAYRYKELYKKELKDLLKSETSGDFGYLLQLVSVPLPEAEAYVLYHACKGAGTSEQLVYPIIMGRTNEEMTILRKAFFDLYNKDLAVLLDSELSGDFRKAVMAALQSPMVEYNSSFHTKAKAEEDAEKLYKAGQGKWGTDEETFIKLLVSSPPKHLAHMNEIYLKKHNNGIKVAVEKEFSGDAKKALLYFVRLSLEPAEFLAEHFESTMKGFGTDEKGLSAALVRYHAYLPAVRNEYVKKYGKSLKDRIHGETSGDYRKLLEALLEAPTSAPALP
ncbi:TPA: hypothetical protein N0F65_001570 [Lagenidium giganteum]|uniref:Annexin n=1 Tax=Lagenidium giganteum TaxID=4803 RepID=A0AAV2YIV0_9STRA|nr:TPA: hypothetical protein N0F65_001570 [Lagenidium giganteum]